MNNESSKKLAGVIELLLESSSRINEAKPQRYWYPLSMASYGVEEIIEAIDSLCSFRTTMWEKTQQFEKNFCAYQGAEHAIMVNSGSSADLLLCFLLTNFRTKLAEKNASILVPVLTWPTQIWSAMMAGLNVKLVDVDPQTMNMDLEDLEAKITPDCRAIFPVHLMGNPCNMSRITELAQKYDLIILEDCCEALGAEWDGCKVGNFGVGGTFSFFFSHHMTTMEGGLIVCSNAEFAEQLRILRAHGWLRNVDSSSYELDAYDLDPRYAFVNWGFNLRPTEIQASFGLRQLEKLQFFNKRREELSAKVFSFLSKTEFLHSPVVLERAKPCWFAIPISVDRNAPFSRTEITQYLEACGIETRPIVVGNITKHPVARLFQEMHNGVFPGADAVHRKSFYIGLSPLLSDDSVDRLLKCFEDFLKKY